MKAIVFVMFIFMFSAVKASELTAIVVTIHDGDTLQVKIIGENKSKKVRLLGIDSPETDYLGTNQGEMAFIARDFLKSLLPIGSTIQIKLDDKTSDVHDRLLGNIYYQGQLINELMLERGMAYLYFIYPFDKSFFVKYSEAAKRAEEHHLGIFQKQYNNLEAPYLFRQHVQGQEGSNYVANYALKLIYSQKDIALIPIYLRVFFAELSTAKKMGYSEAN